MRWMYLLSMYVLLDPDGKHNWVCHGAAVVSFFLVKVNLEKMFFVDLCYPRSTFCILCML